MNCSQPRFVAKRCVLSSLRVKWHTSITNEAYKLACNILRSYEEDIKKKTTNSFDSQRYKNQLIFLNPIIRYKWNLNELELKVPKFCEMSNYEWYRNKGPQLTRLQAVTNKLIPFIVPDETNSFLNLNCSFSNTTTVGRGNLILPEECIHPPTVKFSTLATNYYQPKSDYYSLVFLDCDYPVSTIKGKLHQLALWLVTNIQAPQSFFTGGNTPLHLENPVVIDKDSPNQYFQYIPPHPARGKGISRYLFVLLSHPQIISMPIDPNPSHFPQNRIFMLSELCKKYQLTVEAYSWFISTWTKSVSALFEPNNPLCKYEEFVYGLDFKSTLRNPRPYKFKYI